MTKNQFLYNEYRILRKLGEMLNFSLISDEKIYKCHFDIIKEKSNLIKKKFNLDSQSLEININPYSEEIINSVLDLCYNYKIKKNIRRKLEFIELCEFLEINYSDSNNNCRIYRAE